MAEPKTREQLDADWWAAWRKKDFSWPGLTRHEWQGWTVTADGFVVETANARLYGAADSDDAAEPASKPEGRAATLQDYWSADPGTGRVRSKDEMAEELITADGQQTYHQCHLPMRYEDGTPTGKGTWSKFSLDNLVSARIRASKETFWSKETFNRTALGPDHRAQLQGGVWIRAVAESVILERPLSLRYEFSVFIRDAEFGGATFCGDALFDGVTFFGDAKFQDAKFNGEAAFVSSSLLGDVSFYGAVFSGDVSFNNAYFCHGAWFEKATFSGLASFVDASFLRFANFAHAGFSGVSRFDRVEFLLDATFKDTSFARSALFESAQFSGAAEFKNSKFSSVGTFNKVIFGGEVDFNNATFSRWANFEAAVFSGLARFDNCNFGGSTRFGNALFSGPTRFDGATFSGSLTFYNATFSKDARFDRATFSATARFVGASFFDRAFLKRAKFDGETSFENCSFEKETRFDQCAFSRTAQFNGAIFKGDVNFCAAIFDRLASFEGISWPEQARHWHSAFDQTLFRSTVVMKGSGFGAFAAFDGATLERGLQIDEAAEKEADATFKREREAAIASAKLDGADFKHQVTEVRQKQDGDAAKPVKQREIYAFVRDARETRLRELERGCRVLKLSMEQASNRTREQLLYRFELRARRAQRNLPFGEKTFSYLYAAASDYGASMWRPFAALALLIIAFASAFFGWSYALGQIGDGETQIDFATAIPQALDLSWANVFKPLSALTNEVKGSGTLSDRLLNSGPWIAFAVRAVATLESLLAIVLAFLFALAVRRRFQIS